MKHLNNFLTAITLFTVIGFILLGFKSNDNRPIEETLGGGEFVFEHTECLTDADRTEIWSHINSNIERLKREGKLTDDPNAIVSFSTPMKQAANLTDPGFYGISNYVDQNTGAGLLDFNCGQRTYNGHKGTDYYSWPFGWFKMDFNQVEIIAGAPGTIIYKNDGQFDRSCSNNNNIWNAVYIRHADNSIAWYGHLKKNSLTTKAVGETVAEGEYLGIMGSSGNSTGPHLHLEVYNSSNQLIDPYQGTCNSLNAQSWWANQTPYINPRINALKTHARPPVFPTCPGQENPNYQTNFNRGDSIYFIPYFADQPTSMPTQMTILYPNNTVWDTWSFTSPQYYSSSYWWWWQIIPANAPLGQYTLRAVFNGVTYETNFDVGTTGIQNVTSEVPMEYSLLQNYPNPFNPATKIRFDVPAGVNSNTKVSVFDITGKEVATLVNEQLAAGSYEYTLDGSDFASGMYFYRMQSGNFIQTKKMLLVK